LPDRAPAAAPATAQAAERGAAPPRAAGARLQTRPRGLDPRSKLLLVVAASIAVMGPGGLRFVLPVLAIGLGLALWDGARSRAAGLVAAASVMWVLGWLVPLWWPNPVTAILSIACVYLIRFVAAIGIGMHVIATTSPTQLSAALRAWRAPRVISVTLATVLRFFPVVASEAAAVLDAMRLRGLAGAGGMLRHPILSIERFTVPMIAASLRASEDLSASAILRGLGSHHRPTAMVAPRFGIADLLLALAVAALVAVAVLTPSPLA
jgi:energy-coupling factor transport system permease protein